jgi:hypothetical protein
MEPGDDMDSCARVFREDGEGPRGGRAEGQHPGDLTSVRAPPTSCALSAEAHHG